jgi:membrane protease YdiL (CAAX protease family)
VGVISGRLLAWLALAGTLSVLNYASRATSAPPRNAVYHYSLAVGGLIQYGVILGLVLVIAGTERRRELLALRAPRSWGAAARQLAVVLIGIYLLSYVFSFFLNPGREQGLSPSGWDSDRAGAFAASFVVLAVVGPIVEELQFRGLGYSLLAGYGSTIAIVVVGVTFGLAHGLVQGLPILIAFGAGLAWVRSQADSVYPCIAAHMAFNSIALVVSVTT